MPGLKQRQEKKKPVETKINMTPMIDVVFQLLIFFVVVAEISNLSIDQDLILPVIDKSEIVLPAPGALIINMQNKRLFDAEALISIAGKRYSWEGLNRLILSEVDSSPIVKAPGQSGIRVSDLTVLLRGDKSLHFRHVYRLYQICLGQDPNMAKKNKFPVYKVIFRTAQNEDSAIIPELF